MAILSLLLGLRLQHRLIALSFLLLSPLYLFWSRTFMIESTALFFSVAYLALAVRFIGERERFGARLHHGALGEGEGRCGEPGFTRHRRAF